MIKLKYTISLAKGTTIWFWWGGGGLAVLGNKYNGENKYSVLFWKENK